MIEHFRPFIISFLIGFLIGIERERSHPHNTHPMGMRTFVLFALLGTLAAETNSVALTAAIAAFVFTGILLGYVRTSFQQPQSEFFGLTSEMAAGVVFCLGYITLSDPLLTSLLAAILLLILISKERLHEFARQQIKRSELRAAVSIVIIALGIIPFLPNYPIDPWALLNPRRFGILVLLLAIVQFGGYVAIRVFGQRLGSMLMGFCGGLASSTAVFAALPKTSKKKIFPLYAIIVSAIFAVVGMLVKWIVILFAAAPSLMVNLLSPAILMIIVGCSSSLLLLLPETNQKIPGEPLSNPLDVKSVIQLAALLAAMLILATLANQFFGKNGLFYVSFLAALFELHGISLATATLFIEKKISFSEASLSLLLALIASFISKFLLLWILAHNRFSLIVSLFLGLMCIVGTVSYYFMVF